MAKNNKSKKIAQINCSFNKVNSNKRNSLSYLDSMPVDNWQSKHPLWSFAKYDTESKWSIPYSIKTNKQLSDFFRKLNAFEGMTWYEILTQTHDQYDKSCNHYIKVDDLVTEAQKRLRQLNRDDEDKIFSLRLTNTHRIFGFRENQVLQILWYTNEHDICKSKK